MSGNVPEGTPGPNSSASTTHDPGRKDGKSLSQIPIILAVVALLLGGSALGIALTNTGHTGPQGTPGGGAVVDQATQVGAVGLSSCSDYAGAQVGFTTTSGGTVVVTAVVWVEVSHSAGNETQIELNLGQTTSDCSSDFSLVDIASSQPPGLLVVSTTLVRDFAISTAGTYTFYVNGDLYYSAGAFDSAAIEKCTTVGMFYPS
ncbi:MAG: hypothetical protein ACLQD8_07525 [Thermoplasmata archaeon]